MAKCKNPEPSVHPFDWKIYKILGHKHMKSAHPAIYFKGDHRCEIFADTGKSCYITDGGLQGESFQFKWYSWYPIWQPCPMRSFFQEILQDLAAILDFVDKERIFR